MSVDAIPSDQSGSPPNFTLITHVSRFMVFWSGMALAAMSPLLPELRTLYNVSVVEISWIFTLLLLGTAVGLSILPRLSDTVGDRFTMTMTPAMLATGLALAATGSFAALLLGAFVMGMGGIATPIVISALRRTLPGQSIARAVSVAIGGVLLGTGVGYLVGGVIEGHLSLREYFVIAAIVSAVVAVAAYKVFPKAPAADSGSLGITSVVLLVAWVVTILFAITKGPAWGWLDPRTIGLIVAGIVTAAFWARREARIKTPTFDVTLLQSKQFRRTMIGSLTLGMGGSAFSVLFPMFAQIKGADYGPAATLLQTGIIMLPYAVVGLVGARVTARLVPRWGGLFAAGIGALGHCSGALWIAFFHDTMWHLFVGAALYGIGIGMLNAGLLSSIQSVVGESKSGMAGSALGVITALSGSVGPIVYTTILAQHSAPGLPDVPAESQFVIAFLVNAAVDLFCAIICFASFRSLRPRPVAAFGKQ
jgi:MFS family permease